MKVRLFCVLMLLLYGNSVYSQGEDIKKIRRSLSSISDSIKLVDAYNRLSILYYEQNIDSTLFYSTKARAISNNLHYTKGKADATNNLGIVFDIKGNMQLALRYYNDAFNQYKEIGDSANIAQTLMNIAGVYTAGGKDQKAIENLNRAMSIGNSLKQDSIMSLVIYNYLLQHPENFSKDSAGKLIKRASDIALKYKDTRVQLAMQQLTADNYIAAGERDKGIALLKQTSAAALEKKLFYMSIDVILDLGNQYMATDENKAIEYYKQALDITEQKKYSIYSKVIVRILYDLYSKKKDVDNAYFYSRKLVDLYSEQEKIDQNSGIDYIEYALKDQQLESVQLKSVYRSRLLWLSLAVCVLAVFVILVLWRYWKRSQKVNKLLKLQFQQLESTTKALETSNQNYVRVIKVVAHDLRNPIGAIYTMSILLLDEDIANQEAQELLPLIQQSSKGCLQLIGDLLETDFNVKEETLHKEDIDLSAFLQQTVKLLDFRAREKNQQLILDDSVHASIFADRDKIGRVFNNLLVNAIKFSPDGAEITISIESSAEGVLIVFRDSGIGIPEELSSRLFDPFTTAKRPGTAGEQPFGLGLYICKQIIEAHHGRIWYKTELNKGTSFYILLTESNAVTVVV